jgi:hypothetical protein
MAISEIVAVVVFGNKTDSERDAMGRIVPTLAPVPLGNGIVVGAIKVNVVLGKIGISDAGRGSAVPAAGASDPVPRGSEGAVTVVFGKGATGSVTLMFSTAPGKPVTVIGIWTTDVASALMDADAVVALVTLG